MYNQIVACLVVTPNRPHGRFTRKQRNTSCLVCFDKAHQVKYNKCNGQEQNCTDRWDLFG